MSRLTDSDSDNDCNGKPLAAFVEGGPYGCISRRAGRR